MQITKTDYLEYNFCKKNLWLKKHKRELFEGFELSDFEKKIIEEGNLADAEARNLFPEGVLVDSRDMEAVEDTRQYIAKKEKIIFQATFAEDDFFIRADILIYEPKKGGYELYEVKASNDIKREEQYNYIKDLAFQKSVIEKSELKIIKTGVIHLNREYKKSGKIKYHELFLIVDLTDEIMESRDAVKKQMSELKQYLDMPEEKRCECLYRGRNNQCTTFAYSNPEVPEYSVHDISRIGASKKIFYDWIDRGIYAIEDIDNPGVLTGAKKTQYDSYMMGKPIIDAIAIKETLDELKFPLYFFDYEGFVSAIPIADGFGAYEQIPFQYSLHIMQEDGSVEHKEFIITDIPKGDFTRPLVERIKQDIAPGGTVISWFSTYEKQRNSKLAELHPDYANYLENLNEGMFDLMSIFQKNYYVDPKFKGSCSIKKVLPVLVPELSYKDLNISKGDQASERWERMVLNNIPKEEKMKIKEDLLRYCERDTWAMVRIYEFLRKI
ncbi:MAG: DUF2779 domain-containing protein [Patescibacteria group bacterium]